MNTKLKNILSKHCPFESTSMRMIQRVCALFIGQSGTIEKAELAALCAEAGLDELANFRANFTMNMKKDAALFDLKKHPESWILTAAGKAEAKSIFDDGEAPSARPALRAGGGKKSTAKASKKKTASKKKAASKGKKKTAAKKKASTKKKATTAKKKASSSKKKAGSKTASSAAKKAALKKKRNLAKKQAAEAPQGEPAAAPVPAAADTDVTSDDW